LYKAYKDNEKVAFFFVYVGEAHPRSEADPDAPGYRGIARHEKIDTKVLAAQKCMEGLEMTMPFLIDGTDKVVEKSYKGKPAATAIVDINGKIVFYSRGPRGVQPENTERVLEKLLSTHPVPTATVQPTTKPAVKPSQKGASKTSSNTERPSDSPEAARSATAE
jgi:hypothetical protein